MFIVNDTILYTRNRVREREEEEEEGGGVLKLLIDAFLLLFN
jgi:hypothetical protein